MRAFIFRGKRINNGEWVEGWFSLDEDNEANIVLNSGYFIGYWVKVDPSTIGQFTGLLDKNGKKIFEGDVVKYDFGDEVMVVSWQNKSCGFEPFSDSNENCGCCGGGLNPEWSEVIGNIHDNPELLQK